MKRFSSALIASFFTFLAIGQTKMPKTDATYDKKLEIYNEHNINTPLLEFSPTFYEDGIVFVSSQVAVGKNKTYDNRIKHKTMSIFLARRGENGKLMKPIVFADELVSLLHEGPLTFDAFKENVYFTRNNNAGKTKATYTDGVSRLKIYTAHHDKNRWSETTELPFNDEKSDACHPTISVDGTKLFFSSNRPGGYGGMDLYVCEKIEGQWGTPTNLGPKINTAKNEIFPFVHANGILYFASDGLVGKGGLDIFYTKPLSTGGFDSPINMDAPFNTNTDDFGLIVDADMKNGYFTSARKGGVGEDDIYSFSAPNGLILSPNSEKLNEYNNTNARKSTAMVHVLDRKTGKEINAADVAFVNLCDLTLSDLIDDNDAVDVKIKTDGIINIDKNSTKKVHLLTDVYGKCESKVTHKCKFIINVTKEEYQTKQTIIKEDDTRTDIIILLDRLNENSCITANGRVVDTENQPISNALVNISDSKGEQMILTTDSVGRFTSCLRCNDVYRHQASKGQTNSLPKSTSINSANCGATSMPLFIELQIPDADVTKVFDDNSEITEGAIYRLKNIYYNFDDATIRPDACIDLDKVVKMMKKFPDVEVELASHTDKRGTDEYNVVLSQRRAENAVLYLVNQGIARKRFKATGYGETRLKIKCDVCTEEEHQKNRRTEIKILKSGSVSSKIFTESELEQNRSSN